MERKDMRKLSFEAREERRRQVVGLRRRGVMNPASDRF
jgi:hypothetical protein